MTVTQRQKDKILDKLVEALELPDTAYQKAEARYTDLGDWFSREESSIRDFSPHIFAQGSFRLGTAIRPLNEAEEYDLDLACKLTQNASMSSLTQEEVKNLVGNETEQYRRKRKISKEQEEKHRCWRLEYQDQLSFHMDIVPCIPATKQQQDAFFDKMVLNEDHAISEISSKHSVTITDDRLPNYRVISDDWLSSNPEGYAQWFENQMKVDEAIQLAERAKVDELPIFKRKAPLQRAVQILKRHRDQMFKDDEDSKPISIIITTLAARAYKGESSIEEALSGILNRMGGCVNSTSPKVPNPVNPDEDFADRWDMPQYKYLKLEQNFWRWLTQAQSDFNLLLSRQDNEFVKEQMHRKFGVSISLAAISGIVGEAVAEPVPSQVQIMSSETPKPWRAKFN